MDCHQYNNITFPAKHTVPTPTLHTNPTKDVVADVKEEAEEDGVTEAEEVTEDRTEVAEGGLHLKNDFLKETTSC